MNAALERAALVCVALSCLTFQFPPPAAAVGAPSDADPPYPRLANVWLHGAVRDTDIPALARWDVVVVDPVWTFEQLARLRASNPDIRILVYVGPYFLHDPPNPATPWEIENFRYAEENDLWWYDRHGRIASDWPRTRMVNITDLAPGGGMQAPGRAVPPDGRALPPPGRGLEQPAPGLEPWREFLAARVEQMMAARPMLDGVFYDNFWRGISWEQERVQLDSDCNPTHRPAACDGRADAPARLDSLWNAALRDLARDTRARFDGLQTIGRARPLAIVGNGVSDYFEWLNGGMYENFTQTGNVPDAGEAHGYTWRSDMLAPASGYLTASFRAAPYRISIVNAAWGGSFERPERSAEFERHKRFTLVSALLGDGYYSLDPAQLGHGALWWEPEFDHDGRGKGYLGYARGPAYALPLAGRPRAAAEKLALTDANASGLYRRDFERGIVVLNYTKRTQRVRLGGTYYRLRIAGSKVFDGAAVRIETIPPADARILLTRPPGR